MAYMVNQLRRVDGRNTYMSKIELQKTTIDSANKYVPNSSFQDVALYIPGVDNSFKKEQIYYFRFAIKRVPQNHYKNEALVKLAESQGKQSLQSAFINSDTLNFTLFLTNTEEWSQYNAQDDLAQTPQEIDTIIVESLSSNKQQIGQNLEYKDFVIIFSPIRDGFDRLVFRLGRDAYDALVEGRTWLNDADENFYFNSDETNIENSKADFCKLNNIITNPSAWIKLGFQSRPGTQIVVNNEPMRVGRSGIYEIGNDNQVITKFMIAAPNGFDNSQIDAFLLDYAYKV